MAAKERDASESAGVRVPPPLLYLAGLIFGISIDLLLGNPPTIPSGGRVALALLLALAGGGLIAWAIAAFERARTTILPWGRASFLVPGGPYRFTRNPMYLGLALVYAGIAVALASTAAALLLAPVLVVIRFHVIAREERHLEARFGDEYRDYCARVRRWM